MKEIIEKASILIESLPYIKKFYGTTIVIKYGGHAMVDKEMREKVISDIVLMRRVLTYIARCNLTKMVIVLSLYLKRHANLQLNDIVILV